MWVHQSKGYLIKALVKYSQKGAIRGKHPSWGFQEITSFLEAPIWGLYAIYCINFRSEAMLWCSTTFPLKRIRKFWGMFKYNIEAYTCIHNCRTFSIILNPAHSSLPLFIMYRIEVLFAIWILWIFQHTGWKNRAGFRNWLLVASPVMKTGIGCWYALQ